jgi:hypothetical protein
VAPPAKTRKRNEMSDVLENILNFHANVYTFTNVMVQTSIQLVIAIPDHFRNPGIPGLIPGLEFQIYVGKLAVSRIVGKAYYRPTDSKGLISV